MNGWGRPGPVTSGFFSVLEEKKNAFFSSSSSPFFLSYQRQIKLSCQILSSLERCFLLRPQVVEQPCLAGWDAHWIKWINNACLNCLQPEPLPESSIVTSRELHNLPFDSVLHEERVKQSCKWLFSGSGPPLRNARCCRMLFASKVMVSEADSDDCVLHTPSCGNFG